MKREKHYNSSEKTKIETKIARLEIIHKSIGTTKVIDQKITKH